MTTLTTPAKEIKYNRLTKDYDMLLNGEYVGSAACYHAAEVELDRLAYERLDRAGVEPELTLSATALDGGSSVEEIAAEYAEALEPVQPVTYPAWLLNLADPADDDDDEPADDEEGDGWPPDGLDDVLAPPFGAGAAFILPTGAAVQSIILCIGGVSRVVSAQGVAEALTIAGVHAQQRSI